MKMFQVVVTHHVVVSLDETKFTPEFLAEFKQVLYDLDDVEDHAGHLAQLAVRDLLRADFIEGYGAPADMGITTEITYSSNEIEL